MARVLITGSSDGLGLMAGLLLADQGHEIVLRARNDARPSRGREEGCAQGRSYCCLSPARCEDLSNPARIGL